MLPTSFSSSGINDMSVYIHCCGLYLSANVCIMCPRQGVMGFGVVCHAFENLTW